MNRKGGSVNVNENYCGKSKSGKCEIYKFTKMLKGGSFYSSDYYVMRKTAKGWTNYINNRWAGIKATKKIVAELSELFSFSEDLYISSAATIINILATHYVPKGERYITKQLLYTAIDKKSRYLVCIKVVNKKYFAKYKDGKTTFSCFETSTKYAY